MSTPEHESLDTPITRRSLLSRGVSVGALALTSGVLLDACGTGSSGSAPGTSTASQKPRMGGTVKGAFGDALSSDSPDPQTVFTHCGIAYSGLVFDTLVALDQSWHTTPMLATDWSVSPDLKRYRFKLRKGVKFHTGKMMTASDVVFSFRRIFDKSVASAGLTTFHGILSPSGVRAVDPTTVQFDLLSPDAYFLIRAGHWYGKIVQDGTTPKDFHTGSFGTGPFKSLSFVGGTGFKVARNDDYWDTSGGPYLDEIVVSVITDGATRTEAVLTGTLNFSDPPLFPQLPQFKSSSTASLLTSPFGSAVDIGIDTATAPFNNADFRRGAKMAVNRDKFVSVVAEGFGTASADSIVNPNEVYYPKSVKPIPYDPEQGKALVKRSGMPTSGLTIISVPGLPALDQASVLLKEEWAAVGIDANIQEVTFDTWGSDFLHKKIVANYWLRAHFSTLLPETYTSSAADNESHISNAKIDRAVAQLQRTPLAKGGEELLADILTEYQDAAATIFPFHMQDAWPHTNNLAGLSLKPTQTLDFRSAYLT